MTGYSVKSYLTTPLRVIPPGTVSGVIPTLPGDFKSSLSFCSTSRGNPHPPGGFPAQRAHPCPIKRHWGTIPQCRRGLSGVVAPASASSQIGRAGRTLHALSTHSPPKAEIAENSPPEKTVKLSRRYTVPFSTSDVAAVLELLNSASFVSFLE